MSELDDIRKLLIEIRDNQQQALRLQEEHLAMSRQHLERSREQVEESIGLQRAAMAKYKSIGLIVIPAILFCLLLIGYLVFRYF